METSSCAMVLEGRALESYSGKHTWSMPQNWCEGHPLTTPPPVSLSETDSPVIQPLQSYTYSVFNLVFETSTASTKIWDSLGFKRIGLIKGAGRLRGYQNPVDAIIYGRELGEDEDYVSEERFDKIRFYLEKGKYPPNADRSEKSRLRSATTHYRLEGNKLLLKDKEVISDGHEQYEIAKRIHRLNHGGINKTTAMIADKYHWVRIKETVSAVIKNCVECKETARAPVVRGERTSNSPRPSGVAAGQAPLPQQQPPQTSQLQAQSQAQAQPPTTTAPPPMMSQFDLTIPPQMVPNPLQQQSLQTQIHNQIQQSQQIQSQLQSSLPSQLGQPHSIPSQITMSSAGLGVEMDIPVDPAMMNDVSHMSHHQHQLAPQHQHHPQQHQHHPHPHHHPHAHQAHQINQQHHLQHPHHTHTHPQHIAPVAQMHAAAAAARLMVPSTPHPAPPTPNTTASPGTSSSGAANSATTDGSDFHQLDHHSHHQSPLDPHHAHHHPSSADIARAALTEEDRSMQDQLDGLGGIDAVNVEALGLVGVGMQVGVGVSVGVGVGVGVDVGVVGVSSHGQEMELDDRDLYAHHHGSEEADMKGHV